MTTKAEFPNWAPMGMTLPPQNVQGHFVLDPNMIAALNRLAAALEKYNERAK